MVSTANLHPYTMAAYWLRRSSKEEGNGNLDDALRLLDDGIKRKAHPEVGRCGLTHQIDPVLKAHGFNSLMVNCFSSHWFQTSTCTPTPRRSSATRGTPSRSASTKPR